MAQSKKTNSSKKSASTKKTGTRSAKSKAAEPISPPEPPAPPIRRELGAVVFLFLAVFVVISHYNEDGKFIVFFSNLIKGLIGWGFWVTVPAFLMAAVILGFHKGQPVALRVTSALMVPIMVAALGQLFFCDKITDSPEIQILIAQLFEQGQAMACGGVIGGLIAIGLENAFSMYGALPILLALLVFFVFKCFNGSIIKAFGKARERAAVKYDPAMYVKNKPGRDEPPAVSASPALGVNAPAKSAKPAKAPAKIERIQREAVSPMDIPLLDDDDDELPLADARAKTTEPFTVERPDEFKSRTAKRRPATIIRDHDFDVSGEPEDMSGFMSDFGKASAKADKTKLTDEAETDGSRTSKAEEEARAAGVDVDELRSTVEEIMRPSTMSTEISDPPKKKISRAEVNAEAKKVEAAVEKADGGADYEFPPIDLLRAGTAANVDAREEILINKERLEGAIHSFGINASIAGVTRGPTVTRFDIELEQGVKLARVTNLAGDLALALGVVNVRIAPIPDKISTVGIEVPNKIVSTVYLRDIIESPKFINAKSKLSFALGKDIGGECVVGNIAKLPHMLIAGTTGSGKSVCMNSLILSLLYKARPDEVRLIMIDPKMVELGVYNGIPHLYVPVVTDPKKAAGALQWSVVEMLKRYRLFSEVGVRDLENYNKHCEANGEPTMPRVVIVIDELADLMLVASKEVEESICRVAQMGRAAGMHLVIATQRPSADVITGLMKANIPSRIAFAVSSSLESRIILDQTGAEKLVGMGDMLFSPVGCGKPTRIQGAYVSDEEREDVIQFIKEGAADVQQNDEIEEFMNKAAEDKGSASDGGKAAKDEGIGGGYDEMLPQAVEAILETKSCSVSMLQRRVKLGYSRAARIVDQMEELGIVGPYEGAKPRKVLIDYQGWHDIQVRLGLASDDDLTLAAEMSDSAQDAYQDYDEEN